MYLLHTASATASSTSLILLCDTPMRRAGTSHALIMQQNIFT